MVRIFIVGAGVTSEPVEYPDGAITEAVKEDLMRGFGKGILKHNGVGVLSDTLSGDYEYHVTATSAKRQRTFSSEEASNNTATLRFSTKNLTRGNAKGDIGDTRTCFFAGRGSLKKNADSVKGVWISARHAGNGQALIAGTTASLYISALQANLAAVCVFDCIESDIAFLTTDEVPAGVVAHNFGTAQLHQYVFAAGFGTASDIRDGNPTICEGMVCREKADKAMKIDAAGEGYRCNRFFMVQMVADHGFSGGPVYDSFGYVLGMLCAGDVNGLPLTYVLKSSHLEDNLLDAFVMEKV